MISDFAIWDDVTRIPGVILERKRAEEIYNDIRTQALDPGLLQMGERMPMKRAAAPSSWRAWLPFRRGATSASRSNIRSGSRSSSSRVFCHSAAARRVPRADRGQAIVRT